MAETVSGREVRVPRRVLDTLLVALSSGVVPRTGAPYIAIGRNEEIAALLENLSTVRDGGGSMRFLIGRYGSGKSFLMQLIRGYALDRGFVTADADLSPERRLCGTCGIATYRELIRNMACKTSPEKGAVTALLNRFFLQTKQEIIADGILPEDTAFVPALKRRIYASLAEMEGNVGGFDFATVISAYYDACLSENEEKKSAALRWLRGEYVNKTEAKRALELPISVIIGDENWYDFIKLWAVFSKHVGYEGLIVFIDECVNLYKIPNRISREANYEKLLAIFNDTLQGRAPYLGMIFSGTPQFLEDSRRGLFSYDALKSRLADSRYQEMGFRNLSSPVIRLRRLSDNELLALLARLTKLWEQKYENCRVPTGEQMQCFLAESLARTGADELMTPRELIRNYLALLAVLRDNPEAEFSLLVKQAPPASSPDDSGEQGDDLLDFEL